MIFTDASSKGRATYVVNGKRLVVQREPASDQIVELWAVGIVFQLFADKAFNLYTHSQYIFNARKVLETILCITIHNEQVKVMFHQIQNAIQQRKLPCFVGHIREHSNLPGTLAESNALFD